MGKLRKSRNSTPSASLSKATATGLNPNASPMSLRTQAPAPSSPGGSSVFDDSSSIRSGKSGNGVGLGLPQSGSVRSMRSISSASISLDTVTALPILSTISTSPSNTTSVPLDSTPSTLSTPTKANSKSPPTSLPSTPPPQQPLSDQTLAPKSSSSALATLRQRLESDEAAREKERIAALNGTPPNGAKKLRKRRPTGEGMSTRSRREGSVMSYETTDAGDPDLDQEIEIEVGGGELEHEVLPGQSEEESEGRADGIWKGRLVLLPARLSYAMAKRAVSTSLAVGSHIPIVSSLLPASNPNPTFTSTSTSTTHKSHATSPSTSTSSSTLHPSTSPSTSTAASSDSLLSPTEKKSSIAYKALEVGLTAGLATALVAGAGVSIGWGWVRGKKVVLEEDLDQDYGENADDGGGVGKGKGKYVVH